MDLTENEHKYLLAAWSFAKGREKRTDTIEDDVAGTAGISKKDESAIKDALVDKGLIQLNDPGTKEFIFIQRAGENYCKDHSEI